MRASVTALAIVGLLGISMPSGLDSCGPGFPPTAVFATSQRPADLSQFLMGKVGVLRRTYDQKYLIGGFRILSGIPLTETEAQSIYNFVPGADLPHNSFGFVESPGFDAWKGARESVSKLGAAPPVDVFKTVAAAGLIYSFRNCTDDAFLVAADSLAELSKAWGDEDPKTLDWVRAQDRVFANCPGKDPTIPDPPQANADTLFAAYRRYQIAAALLYSGQSRKASEAFEQIAADRESPWRGYGPYLAARALLRAGTLDGDREALNEGKKRLLAISEDPDRSEWHDASLRLLHFWQVRGEPRARLAELGRELMKPTDDADVGQSVYDFLYLLNKRRDTTRRRPESELNELENTGELAAWLLSMSATPPADSGEQSVERWRNTRNPAWLISALLNSPDNDLPELLAAVRQLTPTASAYESATYYAISREIDRGHTQEARLWADRALSHSLQRSTRNLILAQRTMLARSWKEFLHFGLRRPEAHILWDNNEDDGEYYVEKAEDTRPMFDADVSGNLNGAPLSMWIDASENMELPAYMRLRIDEAGWLRAVLLGKDDESRKLMERAVTLQPTSTDVARGFLSARGHEEVEFAAIYLVLRNPELSPQFGGGAPADLANAHYFNGRVCWAVGGVISKDLRFLTADELVAATTESKKLSDAERWDATYLARQTVEWTQKHPGDPRVPEALHRAVMASRYRCTDENTGKYSKQAFDLLHRQYPKSAWTGRTPYWYK